MGASENETGAAVPVRVFTVNQAGTDPATRLPPEELGEPAPNGAGVDVSPFAVGETHLSDPDQILAAQRAGGPGQTFTGVAEPGPRMDAFGGADTVGDGD